MGKVKKNATDKVLHPRSRKAAQLGRTLNRDARLQQQKQKRTRQDVFFHRRLVWFQKHLQEMQPQRLKLVEQSMDTPQTMQKVRYSEAEVHGMIRLFLEHRDEALEPHLKKKNVSIKTALLENMEKKEYSGTGLLLPDFTKAASINMFMAWDSEEIIGEREATSRFKLRRFKQPAESMQDLWKEIAESAKEQGKNAAVGEDEKMIE